MSKFIKGMDLSTLLELERCGAKILPRMERRRIFLTS